MIKYKFIAVLLIMVVLSSCREDSIVMDIDPNFPEVETIYTRNISGIAVAEDGRPIANVEVSIGNDRLVTDENGLFQFNRIDVGDLDGVFVKADHPDFFESGARIYAGNISEQYVRIQLVEKNLSATFKGVEGGTINVENETQIQFKEGSIARADGSNYDGLVEVYAYYLDPSQEDFLLRSPGDLSGLRTDGNPVILNSYGMLAVELSTPTGEQLNIAPGQTATIQVSVPESLISDAPTTIPLWHFDEAVNKWVEEGSANLEGSTYVGEVAHFSWWNCDDFSEPITLCVTVNQPVRSANLSGVEVVLCSDIYGTTSATTDAMGEVCGLVPSGEILSIKLIDVCGSVYYSQTIGPFTDSPQRVEIQVTIPDDAYPYDFTGQILTCGSTMGLADALVRITTEGQSLVGRADANGNYNIYQVLCVPNADYLALGIDYNSGQAGAANGMAATGQVNELDVEVCNTGTEYIEVYVNGLRDFGDTACELRFRGNEHILYFGINALAGYVGSGVGTFPMSLYAGELVLTPDNSTVTITQYGDVGSYIVGSFTGIDQGSSDEISGIFSALRTE